MTESLLKEKVLRILLQTRGDNNLTFSELCRVFREFYGKVEVTDSFAEAFREIFPPVKLGTGKNFKSNLRDLEKKLKFFTKNYNYDKETILEAARQYVSHAESVGYQYVRTASFFVHKQGEGSDLADWCERISEEGSIGVTESLHRRV